jgi:hypothetical protein
MERFRAIRPTLIHVYQNKTVLAAVDEHVESSPNEKLCLALVAFEKPEELLLTK